MRSSASGYAGQLPGRLRRAATAVLLGLALPCSAETLRELQIDIRERRVDSGQSTLRVTRGDTVLLHWRSDEAVSLHVHGYDLHGTLSATHPLSMRFAARVAGRFPITAHAFGAAPERGDEPPHQREVILLYLEVLPE